MVYMRVLLLSILAYALVGECAKKEQLAIPSRQGSPDIQQSAAFGTYFDSTAGAGAAVDSRKTFSMKKRAAPAPAARTAPAPVSSVSTQTRSQPEFVADGYVVQVACAADPDEANEIVDHFKGKGYPAYILEVTDPVSGMEGTYYRVRIGCFRTRAEAAAFGERYVKPEQYDFWVDAKANEMPASARFHEPLRAPASPKPVLSPAPVAAPRTPAPAVVKATDSIVPARPTGTPRAVPVVSTPRQKADSPKVQEKSSTMRSPLDLLLKVYDSGSARADTAAAKKENASARIPAFVPPASAAPDPVKSGSGSKGSR